MRFVNRTKVIRVSQNFHNCIKDVMKQYKIKKTSDATELMINKGKYNEIFKI